MPIPDFNERGLIPPFVGNAAANSGRSPYLATMRELVERFGTTDHRRELLRNLIDYRALLAGDGYEDGIQFIDGSFVENVEALQNRSPNDIDIFSLLNAPQRYLDDNSLWPKEGLPFWVNEIVNRTKNKDRYMLDTHAILLQDFRLGDLISLVMYWQSLFSHQKETYAWKGFVILSLDPEGDGAALEALGNG